MTDPVSNAHAAIESELVCPRCRSMNRPGASVIHVYLHTRTAGCVVCSHEGPIESFQPKPLPEGDAA